MNRKSHSPSVFGRTLLAVLCATALLTSCSENDEATFCNASKEFNLLVADINVSDIASSISGSSNVFHYRGPTSSINFVAAHDGFTIHDMVTYNEKHNLPNLESNMDGNDSNRSWNVGHEGESDDPAVQHVRHRLKKSLLATLMLSSGVPMLNMGDEVSRTQNGSNNAYSLPINGEFGFDINCPLNVPCPLTDDRRVVAATPSVNFWNDL